MGGRAARVPRAQHQCSSGSAELPGDVVSSVTLWRGLGTVGASIFGFHVPFACVPARRQKSCVGSVSVPVTASAEPFL